MRSGAQDRSLTTVMDEGSSVVKAENQEAFLGGGPAPDGAGISEVWSKQTALPDGEGITHSIGKTPT